MTRRIAILGVALLLSSPLFHHGTAAQSSPVGAADRARFEAETLEHFQALLRLDTSNPPGNETAVVDYLARVLMREGIPFQTFALEPSRANLVARLRGTGRRRPVLIMGHTDVVTVDPKAWKYPPFSATRSGGHVYGRGALDNRPHVVAGLMILLELKRMNVPLDRDVIFLAESGEEGTTRVGIDFMIDRHFPAIDAEYCLAEGGGTRLMNGVVHYAAVGTMEKVPRTVELIARGTSAHGSVPIVDNPVGTLARAVAAVSQWQAPVRLNDTTRVFFTRLAARSEPADAARFRAVVGTDMGAREEAVRYFEKRAPSYAAVLRTTISPTLLQAGYRYNVIPSEARATLDVRLLPDEDPERFLDTIRRVINDPSVDVVFAARDGAPRPPGVSQLDTDAFRAIEDAVARHYNAPTIPAMGTGATDSAQLRAKGVQCYGIGPAVDADDGPLGFGAHGDQERILESELHRFVRVALDVIRSLAIAG